MKEKQKQKLLNRFRPSLDGVRGQLFRSLEDGGLRCYGLPLQAMLDPKSRQILTIGLAREINEDIRINVPIGDNFNTVSEWIRPEEDGVFGRFRDNLPIEIVSYWNDQRLKNDEPATQAVATPATEETASASEEKVEEPKADTTENIRSADTNAALSFADFSKAVAEYPKFYTEQSGQEVTIYEESADEPRKSATISMAAENEFAIERALERRYKVKLALIPLIKQFAAAAIAERQKHSTVEIIEANSLIE